jgi:hypothetical protein
MVYRTRIKYTAAQKADIWDRWQRGASLNSIGRLFDRPSSSIFNMLAPTGGIRPPPRQRSRLALTPAEREEIPRGLASHLSLRAIATQLGRSPSTISRELHPECSRGWSCIRIPVLIIVIWCPLQKIRLTQDPIRARSIGGREIIKDKDTVVQVSALPGTDTHLS